VRTLQACCGLLNFMLHCTSMLCNRCILQQKRHMAAFSTPKKGDQKNHPFQGSFWLSSFWAAECCNAPLLSAKDHLLLDQQQMQTWSCKLQACLLLLNKVLICHTLFCNCWAMLLICRQNLRLSFNSVAPAEADSKASITTCQPNVAIVLCITPYWYPLNPTGILKGALLLGISVGF